MPSAFTGITGNYHCVSGSLPGYYAAPSTTDATSYLSVPVSGSSGSATVVLDYTASYFGIFWGSMDTYNSIDFYNGLTSIGTVSGSDVPDPHADGDWFDPGTNRYVNITEIAFDSFVLNSSGRAFEVDNIAVAAAPVPKPANIFPIGTGLLGLVCRRKMLKK